MTNEASDPKFFGPILLAKNFEETLAFYRGAIGLPFEGAAPYAKCVAPASTISIVDGKWWSQVNGSENPIQGESSVSTLVLTIQVADVRKLSERLMASGVSFLSVPTPRAQLGVRNVFLRDPDGRSVMLTSPLT
jgi:predicted enzyme related to lactoylglutathione lyase